MTTYWIIINWHVSTTLTEGFSVILLRSKANARVQRRDAALTLPRHGGLIGVPDLCRESCFRHDQSVFESQRAFQPKLCPLKKAYDLLSNGPHLVHVEVFKRDGNSLA